MNLCWSTEICALSPCQKMKMARKSSSDRFQSTQSINVKVARDNDVCSRPQNAFQLEVGGDRGPVKKKKGEFSHLLQLLPLCSQPRFSTPTLHMCITQEQRRRVRNEHSSKNSTFPCPNLEQVGASKKDPRLKAPRFPPKHATLNTVLQRRFPTDICCRSATRRFALTAGLGSWQSI